MHKLGFCAITRAPEEALTMTVTDELLTNNDS
jgi:hypothetical protein